MAGVRRSLTVVMIKDALRLHNQGESFMEKNKLRNKTYYRSKVDNPMEVQTISPLHQRFSGKTTGRERRVLMNPPRDYFIDSTNHHFGVLNHALRELEEKEEIQKEKETEQEERERSKISL